MTGATGGLGQAIAAALHARGAQLTLTGRRADVLSDVAQRHAARALPCDMADRGQVERLARDAADCDVVVLNAGLPAGGAIGEQTVTDIDAALEVNLRAPMVLARLLSDAMITRGGGHIVLMSSLAGKAASPGGSVYSATKFGLRGFGLGLREDLAPHSVGVSVVFPGFISDAGMFAYSQARLPRYVGTRTPEDVAAAVLAAIEHDRAEIDVAPLGLRVGTALAGLAPGLVAAVQRRLGAGAMSAEIASGQARAMAARRGGA